MESHLEELCLPFNVEPIYCTTREHCEECCQLLLSKPVWGFDCEWKVSYEKGVNHPVALIQFACADIIILLHIHVIGEITPGLNSVLKRSDVFKVGVNINNDVTKLRRSFPNISSDIGGVCDLRSVYKGVTNMKSPRSLAALVSTELNKELPKPHSTRCGNWELVPLTRSQIAYAALDAYASYLVFQAIRCRVGVTSSGPEALDFLLPFSAPTGPALRPLTRHIKTLPVETPPGTPMAQKTAVAAPRTISPRRLSQATGNAIGKAVIAELPICP